MRPIVNKTIKVVQYKKPTIETTQENLKDLIKINVAKFLEQEIKDAYNQGYRDGKDDCDIVLSKDVSEYSNAQNYYNETFRK